MNTFCKTTRLPLLVVLMGLLFAGNYATGTGVPSYDNTIVRSGFFNPNRADDPSVECTPQIHYVYLVAGHTYFIRLHASEPNTWLTLEDLSGKCVATDNLLWEDIGGSILFRPTVTDEYRIVAGARMPIEIGYYALTIHKLPLMFEMEATMDPAEEWATHSAEVRLEKGRRYVLEVSTDDFPAVARLMNADGAIVAFDDEGCFVNCTRIVFTAPRTEAYRFEVLSNTPFVSGTFRMTVSEF